MLNLRPLHLFTSSSCSGDSDPIFIPGRRAAGWFGVDPPHLRWTLRVGCPRVARGGCEGVGDVPCRRGACRTRGRSPASRPWPDHWYGPAPAGCRCSTSTIAFARECGAVPPPCPRGVARTNGCRSTGRCVGRGCDVSESGRGPPGPGPTVRRVRGDVMRIMNGPRAGPSRWGALRSVVQPGEAACGPGAVERGSMR